MRLIARPPRLRAVVVGIAFATWAIGTPAHAQTATCDPNAPNCEIKDTDEPPGSVGPVGDPNAPIWTYFLGPANAASQSLLPPGTTRCYNTGLYDDTGPGGAMTLAAAMAAAFAQLDAPGCPDLSGLGISETIGALVPPPEPQIRPGRNVTGLRAYLETGLKPTTQEAQALGVTMIFVLEPPEITVDWGDGSPKETYDRPGVPYQERDGKSEITHMYERSGEDPCDEPDDGATCYTVTVDAVWPWTATVAGDPGAIPFRGTYEDPRQGSLTLPVEELQAVRRR